jgi:hypothetical protein
MYVRWQLRQWCFPFMLLEIGADLPAPSELVQDLAARKAKAGILWLPSSRSNGQEQVGLTYGLLADR